MSGQNTKTIGVKLNSQLEAEGRGLCDPDEPRNDAIITPSNYNAKGYLKVHDSGFIQAMIASGSLIPVAAADETKLKTVGKRRSRK